MNELPAQRAGNALARLLIWLSPAFPIGAFAYSQGLETQIGRGAIRNAAALKDWLAASLEHGGLYNDAILVGAAHAAPPHNAALHELAHLCMALAPARERQAELLALGTAFQKAAAQWPNPAYALIPSDLPYPIAVGAIAAAHGIARGDTLIAYLSAQIQSQISVGLRLIPIGQTEGLALQAELEPAIISLAQTAQKAGLDQLGGIAHGAEIAMMAHERLESRIFKS